MRLRDATLADLRAISELEKELFGSDAWSPEMVREELAGDNRRYIVLTGGPDAADAARQAGPGSQGGRAERIRGYAGLLVLGTDGDIQTIAVDPAARGAGHGRALMNELLDEAERRGASQVFLEVRADNPTARGLYASLGFAEIGVRERYYQPEGVDAIVMRVQLRERQ